MLSGQYTKYDAHAEKSPFYKTALEAIEVIKQRFPQGGINQVDAVKNHNISPASLVKQLQYLVTFGSRLDTQFGQAKCLPGLAKLFESLQGANCGLLTNYALGYLQKLYPNLAIECVFLGDDHNLLAIGRPAKSDPKNIKTWKNTLLCDVWSKQIYLAENFDAVRKKIPDVKFYGLDKWKNNTSVLVQNDWTGQHYLSGDPDIITGATSKAYDKAWVTMVELDQMIFAKKMVKEVKPYLLENSVAVSFADAPANLFMWMPSLFAKQDKQVRIFDVENSEIEPGLKF